MAATSSAPASMSTASTRARGNAFAQASAMQPEPVPMSSTFLTRARVDPRREAPFDELGDGRARNQHAFVDVERQAGEPGLVREIGERHALVDAPRAAAPRSARAARRVTRRFSTRARRVVRQLHDVQHQRRGFIARVVGAMAEDTRARAAGAASTLAIRSATRDVE